MSETPALPDGPSIEPEPIKPEPILTPEMASLLFDFRAHFPEFSLEEYPNAITVLKLQVATHFVSEERFGDLYSYAVGLVAAHLLLMGAKATTEGGGVNPDAGRSIASKSVGGVSISYEGSAHSSEGGPLYFEGTKYGLEYLSLIRMFGMGVVCL